MLMEELQPQKKFKVYVDLDGVLVNFSKGIGDLMGKPFDGERYHKDEKYKDAMWAAVLKATDEGEEVWFNFEMMPDAKELWNHIKHVNPEILSSTGGHRHGTVSDQKKRWVAKYLGKDVNVHLVKASEHKARSAKENHILIDDMEKSIGPWKDAGGIGIIHTSAEDTINHLKRIGL